MTSEIRRLRSCVNNLVSLLELPTVWSGREPAEIVETLLDTVLGMMRLDFAYARLNDPAGGSSTETVRVVHRRPHCRRYLAGHPLEVGRALEGWLSHDLVAPFQTAPNPVGEGEIFVARCWMGAKQEIGVLVAGSHRAKFPTKTEGLLLQVAADQAAIALRGAQILGERKRAKEALREKDDFLATVSHELRAPLNAMLGWTRLLRDGKLGAAEREHALETVEQNARLQDQLIDDLLDVSCIIAGKLRFEVRPVELSSVVEAAVEAMRPEAEAKQIPLQIALDPRVGVVSGDPDRLQQVVWNLLSNAIKFTPQGGRIQVRLERVNSYAELVISDAGVGISPDFLPHVFERFRQANRSSTERHGGLGLGLAIVRHLVELHGGMVHAMSGGEGEGSTFVVKLPITVHEER